MRFRETKAEKCPVPVKFPELWYDRQGLGAVRVPHGVVYNGELFKRRFCSSRESPVFVHTHAEHR